MKTITALELNMLLKKESVSIIDVREPSEHKEEHIKGCCLIPLGTVSAEKLPTTEGKIVIYCRAGKRSLDACIKILAENPTVDVYSLEGGIIAWRGSGFPVEIS